MSNERILPGNGCDDFLRSYRSSRRSLLQAGTVGALGLGLSDLLAAEALAAADRARAKSVILLFNFGGASHLESFDCKPAGSSDSRGEYKPIPTSVPGTQVCELLPNMAKLAHEYAIVRSVNHKMGNHNAGG